MMTSSFHHTSSTGRLGYFTWRSFSLAARMEQYQLMISCRDWNSKLQWVTKTTWDENDGTTIL